MHTATPRKNVSGADGCPVRRAGERSIPPLDCIRPPQGKMSAELVGAVAGCSIAEDYREENTTCSFMMNWLPAD